MLGRFGGHWSIGRSISGGISKYKCFTFQPVCRDKQVINLATARSSTGENLFSWSSSYSFLHTGIGALYRVILPPFKIPFEDELFMQNRFVRRHSTTLPPYIFLNGVISSLMASQHPLASFPFNGLVHVLSSSSRVCFSTLIVNGFAGFHTFCGYCWVVSYFPSELPSVSLSEWRCGVTSSGFSKRF